MSVNNSSISAIARIRPMLDQEAGSDIALTVDDSCKLVSLCNWKKSGGRLTKTYKMKHALNDVSQQEVFTKVLPMIEGAINGVNTSIIAYGQTGTGKTKSMLGYDMWALANSWKTAVLAEQKQYMRRASTGSPSQRSRLGTSMSPDLKDISSSLPLPVSSGRQASPSLPGSPTVDRLASAHSPSTERSGGMSLDPPGSPASHSFAEYKDVNAQECISFDDTSQAGLIPRAMEWLFEKKSSEAASRSCAYSFSVTYLEIYNECVRDLLDEEASTPKALDPTRTAVDPTWLTKHSKDVTVHSYQSTGPKMNTGKGSAAEKQGPGLSITMTSSGRVRVLGAKEIKVSNMVEVMELLWTGAKARSMSATDMNQYSSRSHTIFTVFIHRHVPGENSKSVVKLAFVDLAGSEKVDKYAEQSMAETQLLELKSINKSLGTLTQVISGLLDQSRRDKRAAAAATGVVEEKKKGISNVNPQDQEHDNSPAPIGKVYIPYRDSKLTRCLQDTLGNDSKTLFLCTLSPSQLAVEESASTLSFAERALRIQIASNDVGQRRPSAASGSIDYSEILANYETQMDKLKMCINFLCSKNEGTDGTGPAGQNGDHPSVNMLLTLLETGGSEEVLRLSTELEKTQAELKALKESVHSVKSGESREGEKLISVLADIKVLGTQHSGRWESLSKVVGDFRATNEEANSGEKGQLNAKGLELEQRIGFVEGLYESQSLLERNTLSEVMKRLDDFAPRKSPSENDLL